MYRKNAEKLLEFIKKSPSAFCQNIIQIIEICGEILNDFLCCSGNFFVYNLQIQKIILY